MSPRRPTSEELTTQQILDAARQLFAKKGYHAVSMREIGRILGCSHGAIYYHFKDKNHLFAALVKMDFHLLDEILDRVSSQPHTSGDILLGFIEFGLINRHHFEVMFVLREVISDSSIEQAAMESYEKFAQCISAAHGSYLSPQIIWSLFLSAYGFIVHYLNREQGYEDLADLAHAHVSFLMKSL